MASNKVKMLKPNGKYVSVAIHNIDKYIQQGWKTTEMLEISEVGDFLVASVEANENPKIIEATNINPINGKIALEIINITINVFQILIIVIGVQPK